jgi:DNA-binding Lrp family transcriptional regulator
MQIKAEIKGEIAEDVLYEFTNANRGLSMYEIAERLGWKAEAVYNLVKMLEEGSLI